MNLPNLQNDSKHIDIRRLKVNAQITALITLIEFLGNLTMLLHLFFVESNPWSSIIHTMVFYDIIIPYALLANTKDNKNRIIDSGWKSIFKNLVRIKPDLINDSENDLIKKNESTQENANRCSSQSKFDQTNTSETSDDLDSRPICEISSTMRNENDTNKKRAEKQKQEALLNPKNKKGSVVKNFSGTNTTVSIISPLFRTIFTNSEPRRDTIDCDIRKLKQSENLPTSVNENKITNDIGTSLRTRKLLLFQMIKDVQNETKYLKSLKLLIFFEDHRQEGIILSISELNSMYESRPIALNDVQKVRQEVSKPHHARSGHDFKFVNAKKQNRNEDKSNHHDKRLKLKGKLKERRRMRNELLCRYEVSNCDDQSIEYLIENLIKLEKSLIVD